MIAVLYCDRLGPYPKMSGVDAWDIDRDARDYEGPWPVVAHPPCGPWSALRHMHVPNQAKRLRDAECGPIAVRQVQTYGGVLEQPAASKLWAHCGLPLPGSSDAYGFSIQVEQVSWGHVARKKTWLYICGVPLVLVQAGLRNGGTPTHWVSGGRKRSAGRGGLVPPGIKVCSAQQRRRTPPAFAAWLVELARAARRPVAADCLRACGGLP